MNIYGTTLWLFITMAINVFTHFDGKPEEEPINGRYKVSDSMYGIVVMVYYHYSGKAGGGKEEESG